MRKALLGIAVLAGAAVAVFIAAVLSVYYAQEKASRAGYYTLHNIDAERGIFSETGDFLGEKGLYYNKNGEPVTGVFKMFYPFGRVVFTVELAEGKFNGEMRYYSFGGVLRSVSRYKAGRQDGETVLYDKAGRKKGEISYADGVMHGAFKMYYPDGSLRGVRIMDAGRETGDFRAYNRDGTLKVCGGSLCEEGDKTPNQ